MLVASFSKRLEAVIASIGASIKNNNNVIV